MSFKWVGLSEETAETLQAIFKKAKKDNMNLTETKFMEHIVSEWLEPYKREIVPMPPRNQVALRNNLKQAIKLSGKSQTQIAKEVGINRAYIGQLISGKYDPSLVVALLITKAVGYSISKIEDLFYLEPANQE